MSWTAIDDLQTLSAENIEQIYNNLNYIYSKLTGIEDAAIYPSPAVNGLTGYDTPIGSILGIIKGIEENIDSVEGAGRTWVNEYYVESKMNAWTKRTRDKYQKVKRWLDYMNLDYKVLTGRMPQPQYLTDINGEYITDINNNKILCYGEVYAT